MRHENVLTLIFVLLSGVSIAAADGVTCRSGVGCLNGTDSFNWGTNYGPSGSDVPNNSTAISSSGNVSALVTFAGGGDGQRQDQGNTWAGNFNPGDQLLWTNSPGQGPLTFTLSGPISGFGANIQADFFGDFTAELQLFDSQGTVIDTVTETGTSNLNADGSAIFLGAANDPGTTSATFSLINCPCDTADFAINTVDITMIPEPSSYVLLSLGFMGFFLVRKR